MPTLGEITALLDEWFPPDAADDWDAVGLVLGDPSADVRRILLAVDPVTAVADEAILHDVDLLVTHHPLFLKGVHGFAATDPKGRLAHRLVSNGCALFTAHTNADSPPGGVSESLALAVGLADSRPLDPRSPGSDHGSGRIGRLSGPISLRQFAEQVAAALPPTAHGVRVAGDPDRTVETVALCGGAGDFLLDRARAAGADVYLTSDLRHHPASELREHGAPALVDVAHWAAESTWLPVLRRRLVDALVDAPVDAPGDTVEVRLSTTNTDPWTFRV